VLAMQSTWCSHAGTLVFSESPTPTSGWVEVLVLVLILVLVVLGIKLRASHLHSTTWAMPQIGSHTFAQAGLTLGSFCLCFLSSYDYRCISPSLFLKQDLTNFFTRLASNHNSISASWVTEIIEVHYHSQPEVFVCFLFFCENNLEPFLFWLV
jgi:hypothetical protein